jgi:predicted HD phosphohydrolase
MGMAAAQAIAELFDSEGARDYLGEPVSVASHLLQAGALASAAGAPYAADAIAVRRWDDQAKGPSVSPPDFARFRPLPERLAVS